MTLRVLQLLEQLPDAAQVPVGWVRAQLQDAEPRAIAEAEEGQPPVAATWLEKLWTVPAETRLGIAELSEAIGKPKSWIYRHTSQKSGLDLLPYRRLDGALVFKAGEIRAWLDNHEQVIVTAPRSIAAHGSSLRRR